MIIPIVLAADNQYVPMAGVVIHSVIANADPEDEYHFYVFHTGMSWWHRVRLEGLGRKNIQVTTVDLSRQMFGIRRESSNHLSIETVYRLFIPEILPQYDKVLYLDCDLVVNDNIAELYKTDISGYILGAAHDAYSIGAINHIEKNLEISYKLAFNAGVLLINTARFRRENVKEKCFALLNEDWDREKRLYIYMDQDVLNIVCYKMVRFFSMEWDFQWGHTKQGPCQAAGIYAAEYENAKNNCRIIHFSGRDKPWQYPELVGADLYWRYARQSPFYEELLRRISPQESCEKNLFDRLSFPFHLVKAKSNIVLYGAGYVGQMFKKQIETTRYCTIVFWSDKNYLKIQQKKYFNVYSPLEITEQKYDYLVIAVEEKKIADLIRVELLELGVPEEKIVWTSYFK